MALAITQSRLHGQRLPEDAIALVDGIAPELARQLTDERPEYTPDRLEASYIESRLRSELLSAMHRTRTFIDNIER